MKSTQVVTLAGYLQETAERFPDRTAVVDPNGEHWTYARLEEHASQLANFLRSRGIEPGDRVGLLLPKSALTVAAIFAILKCRAAYVPADWTAPGSRAHNIFSDCGVRAIFTDAHGLNVLKEVGASEALHTVILNSDTPHTGQSFDVVCWPDALKAQDLGKYSEEPVGSDLAYILYTSGSTGMPKGVMISQENATSFVDWCSSVFHPSADDRFSSHAPFHFDLSILDIYLSLKHGASLHLVSEERGKNPRELAEFVADRRLTVWYSTPSILSLLAQFGNLKALDWSSLRLVLFAGEVFPLQHLRRLTELWPQVRYFNLYGPTETNVCTFAEVPSRIPSGRTEPYPIGESCRHCAPLVLDTLGNPVRDDEEGVLYISGDSVFQGYWNRPKENASAFIERDGVRWYCTGDLVRYKPGQGFIYLGRRDRMVKRRGYRIELDEIECALYRHELIREAAVVSSTAPGGDLKIIAYLTTHAERQPGIIELKAFCTAQLPGYMNPDQFVFVPSLPRTSTNKVDYLSLGKISRSGARTFHPEGN